MDTLDTLSALYAKASADAAHYKAALERIAYPSGDISPPWAVARDALLRETKNKIDNEKNNSKHALL